MSRLIRGILSNGHYEDEREVSDSGWLIRAERAATVFLYALFGPTEEEMRRYQNRKTK